MEPSRRARTRSAPSAVRPSWKWIVPLLSTTSTPVRRTTGSNSSVPARAPACVPKGARLCLTVPELHLPAQACTGLARRQCIALPLIRIGRGQAQRVHCVGRQCCSFAACSGSIPQAVVRPTKVEEGGGGEGGGEGGRGGICVQRRVVPDLERFSVSGSFLGG